MNRVLYIKICPSSCVVINIIMMDLLCSIAHKWHLLINLHEYNYNVQLISLSTVLGRQCWWKVFCRKSCSLCHVHGSAQLRQFCTTIFGKIGIAAGWSCWTQLNTFYRWTWTSPSVAIKEQDTTEVCHLQYNSCTNFLMMAKLWFYLLAIFRPIAATARRLPEKRHRLLERDSKQNYYLHGFCLQCLHFQSSQRRLLHVDPHPPISCKLSDMLCLSKVN